MTRPFIFLAFMLFSSAWAQDNPVQVSIRAFIVAADGTLAESTTAEAGDLIEYQVTATNIGETTLPPESVSVVGPVPESSTFVSGSTVQDENVTLEYSEDGSTFDVTEPTEVRAVHWTLNYPFEPDQEVDLVYRVTINGGTSDSNSSPSGTGSAGAFTQSMFGHLGIIEVECPENITRSAGNDAEAVCGMSSDGFDLFKQKWDLYADYESEVPVIPDPLTSWRLVDDMFTREYALNGAGYIISYFENAEGSANLILAVY